MSFPQRVFLILLLSIPCTAFGQSVDSLKQELKKAKTEDDQLNVLQKLAHAMMLEADTNAIPYYNRIIKIATKRNDQGTVATAYKEVGSLWYYANENLNRSSQAYYKGLEALKDTTSFYPIRAQLLANIGWNYKVLGEFNKALEYYTKAEHYATLSTNKKIIGHILNNKGVIEKDLMLYDSALLTLTKSLQLSREIGDKRTERFNLNNISAILVELTHYSEAVDTLNKVITMNRHAGDTIEIINNLINLNDAYFGLQEYDKAILPLQQALTFKPSKQSFFLLRIYKNLSKAYSVKKDYKNGYLYLERLENLKDSLSKLAEHAYTFELDAKYNSALKDRNLEEARRNLAEHRLYIAVILSMLALVLVAAIFLWRLYVVKKINEKTLLRLNAEIEAQAKALRQSNESIKNINENLENLVAERTLVIKEQNYRLVQFTFMNSHKIRGPIASMVGLIDMLETTTDPELQKTLIGHLKTSNNSLDEIVRDMTLKLEQEGL